VEGAKDSAGSFVHLTLAVRCRALPETRVIGRIWRYARGIDAMRVMRSYSREPEIWLSINPFVDLATLRP
jgi:hypothetical protein